jgi:hypothetical protein
MADNYKILAQDVAVSIEENSNLNQANIVYTVPVNTQAAISSISLINSSDTNEDYYLGVVKAEDVTNSRQELKYFKGAKIYLATGFSGSKYSTDGIAWTWPTPPTPQAYMSSAAYGNGKIVATAIYNFNASMLSSTSYHSTDGITWTQAAMPEAASWSSVTHGDGKFVAVASGSPSISAYSTDGITWDQSSMPGVYYGSVTHGDGRFVAVGDSNSSAYSTDGITWMQGNIPYQNNTWRSVTFGNGKFVAVSSSNNQMAAYSTDGIYWSVTYLPSSYIPYNPTSYVSVTYGNNKFVAVSRSDDYIAYSTDGISWIPVLVSGGNYWSSVTHGDGRFVVVGAYGASAYSTNGVTWTLGNSTSGQEWQSVTFMDSRIELQSEFEVLSDAQIIVPTRSIAPNAVDEISGGITLSAGDQIRIYSESPDLIVQVYGVEIS